MSIYKLLSSNKNNENEIIPTGYRFIHNQQGIKGINSADEVSFNASNLLIFLMGYCDGAFELKSFGCSIGEDKYLSFSAARFVSYKLDKLKFFFGLSDLELNREFHEFVNEIYQDLVVLKNNSSNFHFKFDIKINNRSYFVRMNNSFEFVIDRNMTKNNFLIIIQHLFSEKIYVA